jgi:carboxylate-amine ligase
VVDPKTKQRQRLRDDILRTLSRLDEHALDLGAVDALQSLRDTLFDGNDARWLRQLRAAGDPLTAVTEQSARRWMQG